MIKKLLLILTLCLGCTKGQALEIDNVHFDVQQLEKHVYLFAQPYSATLINFGAVVGEDGVALISSMMLNHAATIEKLVEQVTGEKIRYVINVDADTYQHNANSYFASRGALIVGHRQIKKRNPHIGLDFTQDIALDLGTEVIRAIHTSARSPGDSMIYLEKSNVAFLGDTFRNDWLAYSNESGYKAHARALERIVSLGDKHTRFVPGNRKSRAFSYAADLKKARVLQLKFATRVEALLAQGMSIDEIADSDKVHDLLRHLERYSEFKPYIKDHVQDVIKAN